MSEEKYNIILADCPWSYKDKANAGKRGADHKYPTLTIDDLCKLNIQSIAADNCKLFLWTTWPMIFEAKKLLDAWCFKYNTVGFVWVKTNKKNKESLFWGMGNASRSNSEICLIASKGKLERKSAKVHQIVMSSVRKHSQKPEIVRDKIVELYGDLPRIELFAREQVDGWDVMGDSIDGKDIREILK